MNAEAPLVLIVEDDPEIRRQLLSLLSRWKLRAEAVEDFSDTAAVVLAKAPDLLILDINLPSEDGFSICVSIRQNSRLPILMVSARSSSMDTVMALAQGADDYLTKPFHPEVLVAKVQALLRRSYQYSSTSDDRLRCGRYILQLSDAAIQCGVATVRLTRNEFLIARALMQRPGILVSRDELMQALWQDEIFVDDNTLAVNVSRLRKKIKSLNCGDPIDTRRGRGYCFVAEN